MLKNAMAILSVSTVCYGAVPSSAASAPALKINGYTNIGAIAGKQSNRNNDKGGSPAHLQMNCSEFGFTVGGVSTSGMEYKYRVVFESIPNSTPTITKNYVEFGGDFGTIQAGALKGPEDTMHFNALSLVGGGGGIDGPFPGVFNYSAGTLDGVSQAGYTGKSNKLAMYSPIVSGFQLGVAYTPETTTYGGKLDKNANNYTPSCVIYPKAGSNGPRGRNNWSVGLKYNKEAGVWSYGGAVVLIKESTYMNQADTLNRYKIRNAKSYSLSTFVGWNSWKVAAGWFDNGKSELPRDTNTTYKAGSSTGSGSNVNLGNTALGNAGKAWNLGGQYTLGAYEMAVTYFNSSRKTDATKKATADVVTLSLDYKALEGLKFFGEVDMVHTKTSQTAMDIQGNAVKAPTKSIGNNSGTVMVAGTKLSF